MARAGQSNAAAGVIENEISHADKHVLLDIGIKLPIDLLQYIGRRRIVRGLARSTLRQIAMISEAGTPLPETSAMATPSRSSSTLM